MGIDDDIQKNMCERVRHDQKTQMKESPSVDTSYPTPYSTACSTVILDAASSGVHTLGASGSLIAD